MASPFMVPIRVQNRFGESLPGAVVHARLQYSDRLNLRGQCHVGNSGKGVMAFSRDVLAIPTVTDWKPFEFQVMWEDSDGVVWGFVGVTRITPITRENGDITADEQGFVVTSRIFPQEPLPPEIDRSTWEEVQELKGGKDLLHAYNECRDTLLSGFPNSSVVQAGKALETAIVLRGRMKNWPLEEWKAKKQPRPLMIGDYLNEPLVQREIEESFSPGFYKHMKGTNTERILGAHQMFERVDMANARSVQSDLTKLLNGWFGPSKQ